MATFNLDIEEILKKIITIDANNNIRLMNNQTYSEIGMPSGYVYLDSTGKIATIEMGGSGADATKFLRGDRTWANPGAASHPDLAAHDTLGLTTQAELDSHAAAVDPHTSYQRESEKSAASGYASLDAGAKVPVAELPTLDKLAAPTTSVDFNGQQGLSFRIENRTSDPVSPVAGQVWLRTDL